MTGEADSAKQACPFKVVSLLSFSLQVTLARLPACLPPLPQLEPRKLCPPSSESSCLLLSGNTSH